MPPSLKSQSFYPKSGSVPCPSTRPSPLPLILTEELSSTRQSLLSPGPSLPESTSKFADPPIVYQRRPRPSSPAAVDPTPDVSTLDSLPSPSTVFSQALAVLALPKSVNEALKDQRWLCAMQEEMQALKENRPGLLVLYLRVNIP